MLVDGLLVVMGEKLHFHLAKMVLYGVLCEALLSECKVHLYCTTGLDLETRPRKSFRAIYSKNYINSSLHYRSSVVNPGILRPGPEVFMNFAMFTNMSARWAIV